MTTTTLPITSPGPGAGTGAGAAASAQQTLAAQTAARSTLNPTQFLQLMTTQLKNQDPTQPLDPSQFVGQLAQLSEVSSIQGMQSSIATLVSSLGASQLLTGSTLVGRSVVAPGNSFNLGATGTASGAVTVPAGTTQLQVDVVDASGQVVRQMSLTPRSGSEAFTWDGNTDAGARAPAGTYTIQAIASSGGQQTALATEISTQVQSVSFDSASNGLTLNTADLGSIPFSSVTQVN